MNSGSPDRDPVCGMTVSESSTHQLEHEGSTYRFCSERCLMRFREHPEAYLLEPPESLPVPISKAQAEWVCPMLELGRYAGND